MNQSGIVVESELAKAFAEVRAADNQFLKIEIIDERFQETARGNNDFVSIAGSLELKKPCYVCAKEPGTAKWMLVFFMPDNSNVRAKMVYASSTASLKGGLGGTEVSFAQDFPVSSPEECTEEAFQKQRGTSANIVMSPDEQLERDTHYEAAHAMSDTKVSAIVGIPVQVADDAVEALKGLQGGSHKCVELILDASTEVLGCGPSDDRGADSIEFPAREPRYYVFSHVHTKDGEEKNKLVFVYYCPSLAIPKLKMFYSTCKAHIVKLFESLEITDYLKLEVDQQKELSGEVVMAKLYPPAEVDTSFKKPVARGRGRRKVAAKFKA